MVTGWQQSDQVGSRHHQVFQHSKPEYEKHRLNLQIALCLTFAVCCTYIFYCALHLHGTDSICEDVTMSTYASADSGDILLL